MTYFYLQHPFIQSAKSLSVLNNMIQEALNIMEEESTREDNEVISSFNNIEGKITECWLVNEEGIFS